MGLRSEPWTRRIEPRVSDLEVIAEKLEAVTGLGIMASAVRDRGIQSAADLTKHRPQSLVEELDLRDALAHAIAVSRYLDFALELVVATRLQTQQLLSAARTLPDYDMTQPSTQQRNTQDRNDSSACSSWAGWMFHNLPWRRSAQSGEQQIQQREGTLPQGLARLFALV